MFSAGIASTVFQFTTSRGGRHFFRKVFSGHHPFNSRPPEEVDFPATSGYQIHYLSIHDLPRRSTQTEKSLKNRRFLSIHDLPRRSTDCSSAVITAWDFQFTTSRGGRPTDVSGWNLSGDLSIHDLPRRSTAKFHSFHL